MCLFLVVFKKLFVCFNNIGLLINMCLILFLLIFWYFDKFKNWYFCFLLLINVLLFIVFLIFVVDVFFYVLFFLFDICWFV